jgi:hypothetical protein
VLIDGRGRIRRRVRSLSSRGQEHRRNGRTAQNETGIDFHGYLLYRSFKSAQALIRSVA